MARKRKRKIKKAVKRLRKRAAKANVVGKGMAALSRLLK